MQRRTLSAEEMDRYKREIASYQMIRKEINLEQGAELLNGYLNEWGTTKLAEKWEVKNYNIYDLRKVIRKEIGDVLTDVPRGGNIGKNKERVGVVTQKPKATKEKKSITADIYEQKIKELEAQIKQQQEEMEAKDRKIEEKKNEAAVPAANEDIKTMLELIQEQSEQVATAVQEAKEKRETFHGIAFKFEGEFTSDTLKKRLEKVIHMVEGEPSTFDVTFHVLENPRKDITPKPDDSKKERLAAELKESKELTESIQKQMDELTMTVLTQEEELKKMKEQTDTLSKWENGYGALKSEKQGLHHPDSEFKKKDSTTVNENKIPERSVIERHGVKLFQSFYICPKCGDRNKTFTPKGSPYVNCKKCGEGMQKKDATDKGFPAVDAYGNVYIAGNYVAENVLYQS